MRAGWVVMLVLLMVACNNAPPGTSLQKTPLNRTPQILSLNLKPSSGVAPLLVSLNWSVTDADNQTLGCKIDFEGDGTYDASFSNCTDSSLAHIYPAPGSYTLKMLLDDGHGGVIEDSRSVEVRDNSSPDIRSFSSSVSSGQVSLPVNYSWNIEDPDADSLTCKLDVNNNGTYEYTIPNCDSTLTRSFTFTAPSTYTARLRVEDSRGGFSEKLLETPVQALTDQYDITLRINGTMSDSIRTAFENARKFWSRAIVKGLTYEPNFSIPANSCVRDIPGSQIPAFKGAVDDVLIDVRVAPIDGLGGIAGESVTCWTHGDSFLTLYGVMEFDQADLEDIAKQGLMNRLILHEMGHVLGFGTLWDFKRSLIVGGGVGGACGGNPVFVGSNAVREWNALGGTGDVPIENSGGGGTCNSHWLETSFANELMTGTLNPGYNPLSRLTIASMEDLGYAVNYAAAESYTLPSGLGSLSLLRQFPVKVVKPLGVWQP